MIIKQISSKESVEENLQTWCYEVGSDFQKLGEEAATEFINIASPVNKKYFSYKHVAELGCGDGSSTSIFIKNKYRVDAVDINKEKLSKIVGANLHQMSMLSYLEGQDVLHNIFAHHSLEHTVDAPEIIKIIGEKLLPGGIYYAVVPAYDYLHSVHHVVFENPEELIPPGCEEIFCWEQSREIQPGKFEKEFICIAWKK